MPSIFCVHSSKQSAAIAGNLPLPSVLIPFSIRVYSFFGITDIIWFLVVQHFTIFITLYITRIEFQRLEVFKKIQPVGFGQGTQRRIQSSSNLNIRVQLMFFPLISPNCVADGAIWYINLLENIRSLTEPDLFGQADKWW